MKRILPLILIEMYLGATYLMYRFGVWMFPYKEDNRTAIFVLAIMAAFCIGYLLPLKKLEEKETKEQRISVKFVYALCFICAVLMLPYCYSKTMNLYPPVYSSIKDLSAAYSVSTGATQTAGILHIISGVGRPLAYYLFFVTYYFWKYLGKKIRWVALAETLWFVLVDMSTGHNVGIFSYCIMLIIMYVSWLCRDIQIDKKAFIKRTSVTILAIMIMPLYFGSSLSARGDSTKHEMELNGGDLVDIYLGNQDFMKKMEEVYGYKKPVIIQEGEGLDSLAVGKIPAEVIKDYDAHKEAAITQHPYYADEFSYAYVDVEGKLYNSLPEKLRFVLVEGGYYVSHGYYGVSIGLRQPYSCSFGLGTFTILQGLVRKITGKDFYKSTYVYKLNQAGYPVSLKWGTAFTQFAGDVSYFGVTVIMFLLGGLMSLLWLEVTKEIRLLSLLILAPLGYYMVMIVSWWHPGMSGSDFLMLNAPLAIWIMSKVYKIIKL